MYLFEFTILMVKFSHSNLVRKHKKGRVIVIKCFGYIGVDQNHLGIEIFKSHKNSDFSLLSDLDLFVEVYDLFFHVWDFASAFSIWQYRDKRLQIISWLTLSHICE